MTANDPPAARLQLGHLLREVRESCGKTRDDAAETLECQAPKISKIETGSATIGPGDARLLIDLYGIDGDTAETVLQLARQARRRTRIRVPEWARRFVAMESMAEWIRVYEPELVPVLLQTEDYARAITRAADPQRADQEVERLVTVRAERQARLTSQQAPELSAVINEAVLRRPVGDAEVMREQLRQLRKLVELPQVTLRILPFSAGAHVAMGSRFHLLRTHPPNALKVVYLEDLTSADYLDGAAQTERYGRVFDRLKAAALGEADTLAMLDRTIQESQP